MSTVDADGDAVPDVELRAEQFEALRRAVVDGDGVAFDGLVAEYDSETDSYELETPEASHAGLSEGEFHGAAADAAAYVTNWAFFEGVERTPDRRAYLRWLEDGDEHAVPERYAALAEGLTSEWGQLRVGVALETDGRRRYELRHEADADRDASELETYDDPLAARELAKTDDRGRYRPLKTAPSLQTGWIYADLGATDLVETVGQLYPATIQNWYREREGELDVTHWRETAERQTGIYGIVEELEPRQVDWVARSCCVDSQCLKRREWDEDADTPLEAPRGDGQFPCREPCSLVVAAARRWTTLEREAEREYTFTLTPSEKEQLEALIDAVADDRTDEIREADVYEGANRYRTRFLREKRMIDGELCGVPTEPEADREGHENGDDDHDEGDHDDHEE
jgi:hypothetical protein